jgi:hypothetical protein
VLEVNYQGFPKPFIGFRDLDVRPIEIARAAATVCGIAPGLSGLRRLMVMGLVAGQVLAHLELLRSISDPAPPLRVSPLFGATGRAVAEHLGIGIARILAEQAPVQLVDLYNLDALLLEAQSQGHIDVLELVSVDGTRRRPDLIGSDGDGDWAVLEAKGRSAQRITPKSRRAAKEQAQAIELEDFLGRRIPIRWRLAALSALKRDPVLTYFVDPEESKPERRYRLDPDWLLLQHYRPVADVVNAGFSPERLAGVSGAPGFGAVLLPGSDVGLVIHRSLFDAYEDPERLRQLRSELHEEWRELRDQAAEAEDDDLSLGLDGFGLEVRDQALQSLQIESLLDEE